MGIWPCWRQIFDYLGTLGAGTIRERWKKSEKAGLKKNNKKKLFETKHLDSLSCKWRIHKMNKGGTQADDQRSRKKMSMQKILQLGDDINGLWVRRKGTHQHWRLCRCNNLETKNIQMGAIKDWWLQPRIKIEHNSLKDIMWHYVLDICTYMNTHTCVCAPIHVCVCVYIYTTKLCFYSFPCEPASRSIRPHISSRRGVSNLCNELQR